VALVRSRRHELSFEWVKGHSGDPMNDLVDELAVARRDEHRPTGAGSGPGASASGGGRLADLAPHEQRAERRRRDPRIPAGHLLVVLGHTPDRLGGWDPNPIAESVRATLCEMFAGLASIHGDLKVLTGLRPGAELLAAEAAIAADVAWVAVLGFPDQDRNLSPSAQARFADLVARAPEVVRLERKSPTDRDAFVKALRRRDVWLAAVADSAILVWDEDDDRLVRTYADLDVRLGAELTVVHPPSG
jgi:hypothetical protein